MRWITPGVVSQRADIVSLVFMFIGPDADSSSSLAVVICTRNRPANLETLLICLSSQRRVPALVIIVDSSDGADSELVVKLVGENHQIPLKYLRSSPGLPRQRNVGISFLESLEDWKLLKYVWFLDDDIEFGSSFIADGIQILEQHEDCSLLGAYDPQGHSMFSKIGTSLVSLQIARGGKLLKSGLALPPLPKREFQEADFVPGFSMLVRAPALSAVRFDSKIRMYGEDIEFQLRLRSSGRIGCSKSLEVVHNASPIARESARDISAFSDGFRWRLHNQYPHQVSGVMVIFSSIALLVSDLVLALIARSRIRLESARGHADFILRLVRKQPSEQQLDQS